MIFANWFQQLAPKCGRPEETFPERQRIIDAGDAHADMIYAVAVATVPGLAIGLGQGRLLEFKF